MQKRIRLQNNPNLTGAYRTIFTAAQIQSFVQNMRYSPWGKPFDPPDGSINAYCWSTPNVFVDIPKGGEEVNNALETNYIIVSGEEVDGTLNYPELRNGFMGYFVEKASPLVPLSDAVAGRTINYEVEPDYWNMYVNPIDAPPKNFRIEGDIVQIVPENANNHTPAYYPIKPVYGNNEPEFYNDLDTAKSYIVICFLDANSVFRTVRSKKAMYFPDGDQEYDEEGNVISGRPFAYYLANAGAMTKYDFAATTQSTTNASALNVYVLPAAWVDAQYEADTSTQGEIRVFSATPGGKETPDPYVFLKPVALSKWSKLEFWRGGTPIPTNDDTKFGFKRSLVLANHSIEIAEGYEYKQAYVSVRIGSGIAGGSDSVSVLLHIGAREVDITSSFTCDISINPEVQYNAQHGTTVAISNLTGLLGSIGGAVGGFASGNYFGGIMSIGAGAQQVAQIVDRGKSPAEVKQTGGKVIEFMTKHDGNTASIMFEQANNRNDIYHEVSTKGYVYNPPIRIDTTDFTFLKAGYIKMANVKISGLPRLAAESIKRTLEEGVEIVKYTP